MNTVVIAPRIVVGHGAIARVQPRDYGTRFQVQRLAGDDDATLKLRDQIVECITQQHINVLGEVSGRRPYGDRVIFLGFADELTDDNSHRWANVMRELGRGMAQANATLMHVATGAMPAKYIASFSSAGSLPQPLFDEDGKLRQVALLKNVKGHVATMLLSSGSKYSVKAGVEKADLDLLPDVTLDDGLCYPLSSEALAHLLLEGYLVVAPIRAQDLILAQFKLYTFALADDIEGFTALRDEYRARQVERDHARGIYSYELNQALLDS
jgi:hypothetical protein